MRVAIVTKKRKERKKLNSFTFIAPKASVDLSKSAMQYIFFAKISVYK
jgi:hypothetical protein